MIAALRDGLERLLPKPPGGPLPLALPRRRIYILPSRFGLIYGAALFFLLIGSLNYNNNAAILLALLLAMVAMASAFAAVRFLGSLQVADIRCAEVFAGDAQACQLRVNAGGAIAGDLLLRHEQQSIDPQDESDGGALFAWHWASQRRGRRSLGRIRISTTYPLGLFRAWCVLEPDSDGIVYPAPETPPPPLPRVSDQSDGAVRRSQGEDDWHALREFQRGDSLRDIAWKVSARHDRWLVNEMRTTAQAPSLRFSFEQVALLEREHGIARLTAWILAGEGAQQPYTLVLPDRVVGPGIGAGQRQRALTALAELP